MSISVAKNTAFMTFASIGQKIISFVYFTIVARSIGVAGTGKYFFALSFTTIFVVFVDLGLTNVLVRESAKVKEKIQKYFSSVLVAKVVLGIISYIALIVVINAMDYESETKYLVYISGITMLTDSIHLSVYGILRAIGNLKYEAVGIVLSQLATLILGTIFIVFKFPLVYLMVAFAIPSFLNVIYASTILYKKYGVKLSPRYDREILKYIIPIAIPFALAAIFSRVYSYIDSILLSKLAGDHAVGLYSVPYKIAYAFQFIPFALAAALYPRFSECFVHDKKRLSFLFERGIKYLLIVSLPIVVGINVLSYDIVVTFFTKSYIDSILPLQILMIGVVFAYLNIAIGSLLNACSRQGTQTTFVGIVMVINIIMNVLLIPKFGVVGAAISACVGNIILTILSCFVVPRITAISVPFILKTIIQLVVASGVMGIVAWFINREMNFVFAVVGGGLVYVGMLFITRTITKEQIGEALRLLKSS